MRFVVYRSGWNSANQSSKDGRPHTMEVARVEADTADEACRLAREKVTVYNNQSLSARPEDEVEAETAEADRRVTVTE